MHTVAETHAYVAAAEGAGMTLAERDAAVSAVSANPTAGDMIVGSGGCRKMRLAGRGKGKSGGYRIIFYFEGGDGRVFLLTVFSKGEKANLTKAECNALSEIVNRL